MTDQYRRSPRNIKTTISSVKSSKSSHVTKKRKQTATDKLDGHSVLNDTTTPRTLLENIVESHDTVQSTRKRLRLERSPVKSPGVQRYSPSRQMVLSPARSPTRGLLPSPSRSAKRSLHHSLRKRATMKNFLSQGADGPTPRAMIDGFLNEAAEETTVLGARLAPSPGNDESDPSILADKTRDNFRLDLSQDSFLSGFPDIQASDRLRVLRSRQKRNKPEMFAEEKHRKLRDKDSAAILNSTRRLDTTANVRELAEEMFKDVSVIQPADASHTERRQARKEARDKLVNIAEDAEPSENLSANLTQENRTNKVSDEDHTSSGPQRRSTESIASEEIPVQSSSVLGDKHTKPSLSRHVEVLDADDEEEGSADEVHDSGDEIDDEGPADDEAESADEGPSVHHTVADIHATKSPESYVADSDSEEYVNEEEEEGADNQASEVVEERQDKQRNSLFASEHMVDARGEESEGVEESDDIPEDDEAEDEPENGVQGTSTKTPSRLVQLKITDVLHTPGQLDLLTQMETPGMNTSLRTLTGRNLQDKTNTQPAKKPAKPRKRPTRAVDETKAPSMPQSLTKSIFQHFSQRPVNKQVMQEVEAVTAEYWKNVASDLAAYTEHARRTRIEDRDVELLLHRQGFITGTHSLHALIETHLPLEYRQELIPIARSGNIIQPKK